MKQKQITKSHKRYRNIRIWLIRRSHLHRNLSWKRRWNYWSVLLLHDRINRRSWDMGLGLGLPQQDRIHWTSIGQSPLRKHGDTRLRYGNRTWLLNNHASPWIRTRRLILNWFRRLKRGLNWCPFLRGTILQLRFDRSNLLRTLRIAQLLNNWNLCNQGFLPFDKITITKLFSSTLRRRLKLTITFNARTVFSLWSYLLDIILFEATEVHIVILEN